MYSLARALLFKLNPERAHHLTMHGLARWPHLVQLVTPAWQAPAALEQTVLGMRFAHPVGLAAGLDKDAIAVPGLFRCGFASVEVGTVTPQPQPGNPQPRLFRLKADEALINRMGFNNQGAAHCAQQIARLQARPGIIGINIGKNKLTPNDAAGDDYEQALKTVLDVADYITVNLSSPNTPGLRNLQNSAEISQLLNRLAPYLTAKRTPVFIKLAPDLDDDALTAIAQTLLQSELADQVGIIATNTTLARPHLQSPARDETGGLSGRPLAKRATEAVRVVYQATNGKMPIVGCGGIFDAHDAYEKIRAGASLLQIYTAFIYHGPAVVRQIAEGLEALLQKDGFQTIADAVGCDVR